MCGGEKLYFVSNKDNHQEIENSGYLKIIARNSNRSTGQVIS
jgi:hypothetical protein